MKILLFTDIHFGARQNSEQHLLDCLNYIDWLIDKAKEENIDKICFLGDWYENRQALNLTTLDASLQAGRKLNDLGKEIYFIVGNHDLHKKNNRSIFSTNKFSDLSNIKIIDKMTNIENLLFCPFLFHHEYDENSEFINSFDYVFGHFEFRGFVVTGDSKVLDKGPDADLFFKPKRILSGHFHKRQIKNNVAFIGNTFPTNYGDVHDSSRGCAILDTENNELEFFDWDGCPLFYEYSLSQLLNGISLKTNSRVKCIKDIEYSFTDAQLLKQKYLDLFELREFIFIENIMLKKQALEEGTDSNIPIVDITSLNDVIKQELSTSILELPNINKNLLLKIYEELENE